MAVRTGIVVLTVVVKHICHILTTWRPSIDGVVDAAVSGSVITSAQRDTLNSFLNLAQAGCDILRVITGY
jgi:hypothetical protein